MIFKYNLSGALVEEKYPSGRIVKNEFDTNGDLSRLWGINGQVQQTFANSFSYTAAGGISAMRLGNGKWETAKFNERLQLTELGLGHSATDAGVWKVGYEYGEIDANGVLQTAKNTGNIARQTVSFNGLSTPLVQSYKYDSLYRLKEAVEKSGTQTNWNQSYNYDRYGNRIGFAENIGGASNNQTPAIDPLKNRFTGSNYIYDKVGNIRQDLDENNQLRQFVFNGDNKQTAVMKGTVKIGEYFYDGDGKRVKKNTYDEFGILKDTTVFVYSGGKLIAEYSTKPPPSSPTTNYTVTDQLGSPRVITNSLGEVLSRRDFLPFGEEVSAGVGGRTGSTGQKYSSDKDTIKQKFTGYIKDEETQLDFAEARMYENRHARFTAVDPLLASGKSANPQSFNRYVYVGNNPVNSTDPTGLQTATNPNILGRVTVNGNLDDFKWDPDSFSMQPTAPNTFDENNLLDFSRNAQIANAYNAAAQQTPPPLYVCCVGSFAFPNPAAIIDAWKGRQTGAYNFAVGIPNAPFEMPVFSFTGPSLHDLGVSRPFDYAEYGNSTQAMAGFETQVLLTGASFAVGGEASATRFGSSQLTPNRFYSTRVLKGGSGGDLKAYHQFPQTFDEVIFNSGTKTIKPNFYNKPKTGFTNDSINYTSPGKINGTSGTFEIFTRPSFSGRTEIIWHRFFRPDRIKKTN